MTTNSSKDLANKMSSDIIEIKEKREMTDLATLLNQNRTFAESFGDGHLPISPRMSTILLTCLDARVDPAHFFGLGLGDALVIRNAASRVTPAVASARPTRYHGGLR